jgi:hypothetical protein
VGLSNKAPDGDSDDVVVSPNSNLVAFKSGASNLVAGDNNLFTDIFVRGADGVITRQSVSSEGIGGDRYSRDPAISQSEPNGVYALAFVSGSTNLVPGLTAQEAEHSQVYLRLPHLKKTILISRGYPESKLVAGMGHSEHPSIASLDGGAKYIVAFHSDAYNIVKDASYVSPTGERFKRIYVAIVNAATGAVVIRAFVGKDGVQADGHIMDPFLSGFGENMVFRTDANNMGWGGLATANRVFQVALARKGGAIDLISKGPIDNFPGLSNSDSASMSFNASRIVFKSTAPNIFGASTISPSIVAFDTNTKEYQLINSSDTEIRGNGFAMDSVRLDPKGRLVGFIDTSDNYTVPGDDTNQRADLFVKDLTTRKITRVNLGAGGVQETDGYTGGPVLGTLGYNSQTATVGFYSSSFALRQVGASGRSEAYRSLLTFPPPPLESTTKIESPPDVKPSAPNTLVIVLQKFDASTGSSAVGSVEEMTTKLTYDVRVTQTTTGKQRKVTSTKNRITLRNLTAGQYTVKYRVSGKASSGTKVSTAYSPKQSVTVTKK